MTRRPTRGLLAAIAITAAWLGGAAAMFLHFLPAVATACGVPALDAGAGWTPADARALIAACGPAGIDAYRAQQFADLAYPLLLAAAVTSWTGLGTRALNWSVVTRRLALLPAAAALCGDLAENTAVWALLTSTDPAGPPDALLAAGGIGSAAKTAGVALAVTLLLVLGAALAIRALRRRRGRRGTPSYLVGTATYDDVPG